MNQITFNTENNTTPTDPADQLDPVFDGVIVQNKQGQYQYYQDRNKKWPFPCTPEGSELLHRLLVITSKLTRELQTRIDALDDPILIVEQGQHLYAKKPNISENDVTWSQEEYAHLGLQKEYLRFKSVQRLTESWAALQRARHAGLFRELEQQVASSSSRQQPQKKVFRWASLGGGPGFELVAVRWFFEKHYPQCELKLVSLDLEQSWVHAANGLGLDFTKWDVNDGEGLDKAAGGPVDFALISYVLKMYMVNENCASWLSQKLNKENLKAAIVLSRDENLQHASSLMKDHGIQVVSLIQDQESCRDDRQLIYLPSATTLTPLSQQQVEKTTFPNVPYEEHKKKRKGGAGSNFSSGHASRYGTTSRPDFRNVKAAEFENRNSSYEYNQQNSYSNKYNHHQRSRNTDDPRSSDGTYKYYDTYHNRNRDGNNRHSYKNTNRPRHEQSKDDPYRSYRHGSNANNAKW